MTECFYFDRVGMAKLNDQNYPKEWKKTVDKIISREELILSILNPQYLEETEVNTLFDLIENFESDITFKESFHGENQRKSTE